MIYIDTESQRSRDYLDCNANCIPDEFDIQSGSQGTNNDGILNECDCNNNGVVDEDDIANGLLNDCDSDGIPNMCDDDNSSCESAIKEV